MYYVFIHLEYCYINNCVNDSELLNDNLHIIKYMWWVQ